MPETVSRSAELSGVSDRVYVHLMKSGMQYRESDSDSAVRARVRVKSQPFELAMYVLNLKTDPARARLVGMDVKVLRRARTGEPVGEPFMANLITALRPHADKLSRVQLAVDMDTFFEVTDEVAA